MAYLQRFAKPHSNEWVSGEMSQDLRASSATWTAVGPLAGSNAREQVGAPEVLVACCLVAFRVFTVCAVGVAWLGALRNTPSNCLKRPVSDRALLFSMI